MRLNCEFKVKCRVLATVVGLSSKRLHFIGTENAIHKILKHSLVGPLRADVTKIDQLEIPMHELDYSGFKMIR